MKSIRVRFAKIAAWLAELGHVAAAWRWGAPLARAAAAVLGLLVLAAIGHSALARGSSKPSDALPYPAPLPSMADVSVVAAPPASTPSPPSTPAASALPPGAQGGDGGALGGAPGGAAGADGTPRSRATPDDPVYLNQATLADLRRLPGVGAKRAQAILALRDRISHFRQIEDLLKVKGIGRSSLRKLRPLVRLDFPPPVTDGGSGSGS
jgi:competence protein ComEA